MENPSSKYIKAINKEAVHRICSGQVVLNLATAVKELVENSLDAGATVVEVRLREYGSELIEVTDNGNGVERSNFQGLTLKHHTSKLQDFSDLVSVETFGFRGEALSSLCSVSDLTITTRHLSSECGSRLVYDHNGQITSCSSIARQVGTTVCLENIFSTLPVRQKEFHRNLKREFGKMSQLLYAYCLVSTGIKITCTNQTKKGGRMTVVATQGCKTIRENISCVFGTKQLVSLLEVKTVPPSGEVLEQLTIKDIDLSQSLFDLKGLVSSSAHGQGRSTNDRQYYYVNSRPCEPTKVMKAVNEVYHQYNIHQQPFVFLNIRSARDSVDVNVTPDKRQVFMEHEKLLVATVKSSLQALFENIPSTYAVNNVPSAINQSANHLSSPSSPAAVLSQWRHSATKRLGTDQPAGKQPKQIKLDSIFEKKEKTTSFLNGFAKDQDVRSTTNQEDSKLFISNTELCQVSSNRMDNDVLEEDSISLNNVITVKGLDDNKCVEGSIFSLRTNAIEQSISNSNCNKENLNSEVLNYINGESELKCFTNGKEPSQSSSTTDLGGLASQSSVDNLVVQPSGNSGTFSQSSSLSDFVLTPPLSNDSVRISAPNSVRETSPKHKLDYSTTNHSSSLNSFTQNVHLVCRDSGTQQESDSTLTVQYDAESVDSGKSRCNVEICITMSNLREYARQSAERENAAKEKRVIFRTVIDPSKNKQAEEELSREISKDMFAKMDIVGQFNLGFIIARLNSDLFIVDQHATDEKYNFETLQRNTTISNQKLVVPQQLELTAINESVLIDNISVFNSNGFEFNIDQNAPTTTKVKLTSIPMSRNWIFGKEDIDELLFMLQDAPNTLCRPSRVRAMFASRACRKSVMIGKALSKTEMKRLLVHMGEIEQPWNCPHGRPTMRHLINLDFL